MYIEYKENIPHWTCVSCRYVTWSMSGILFCRLSETMDTKELTVKPYGRCQKWEACNDNEWNRRTS